MPDRIVFRLIFEKMRELAAGRVGPIGYLLDGVPRTIHQAEALDALTVTTPIDAVVHLQVPDQVAFARIRERGRTDDGRSAAHRRLATYQAVTVPMLAWMAGRHRIHRVDANRPADDIASDIIARLRGIGVAESASLA